MDKVRSQHGKYFDMIKFRSSHHEYNEVEVNETMKWANLGLKPVLDKSQIIRNRL